MPRYPSPPLTFSCKFLVVCGISKRKQLLDITHFLLFVSEKRVALCKLSQIHKVACAPLSLIKEGWLNVHDSFALSCNREMSRTNFAWPLSFFSLTTSTWQTHSTNLQKSTPKVSRHCLRTEIMVLIQVRQIKLGTTGPTMKKSKRTLNVCSAHRSFLSL